MSSIKRIFYIYSEASIAVFMLAMGLVELCCGLLIEHPLNLFAYAAAALFILAATAQALWIYFQEQAFNARTKGGI